MKTFMNFLERQRGLLTPRNNRERKLLYVIYSILLLFLFTLGSIVYSYINSPRYQFQRTFGNFEEANEVYILSLEDDLLLMVSELSNEEDSVLFGMIFEETFFGYSERHRFEGTHIGPMAEEIEEINILTSEIDYSNLPDHYFTWGYHSIEENKEISVFGDRVTTVELEQLSFWFYHYPTEENSIPIRDDVEGLE